MELSLLTSVFVLLVSAVSGNPPIDHHKQEAHEHHLSVTKSFHCQHPQPRALRIQNLIGQQNTIGKVYSPEVTVLNRCDDQCGVCFPGNSCGPLKKNHLRLQFMVTYPHKSGSWAWEHHDVEEHTACTCYPFGHEHHNSPISATHWSEKSVHHGTADHINHGTADHINHGTAGHYNHGTADHIIHGTAGHVNHEAPRHGPY